MSSTTQYTDFSDLYVGLQQLTRKTTGVTATENQAKRAINTALYDMHLGFEEKFPWAERRGVLITQAQYTTGTVDISQGSTTLTGTDTEWNTANAFGLTNMRVGGKIVINGGEEIYQISAVGSDTGATLSTKFVDSDVTDGSYVYFEDEYALASDFLRPVDLQTFSDDQEIPIISRTEFRRRYPRNKTPGKPFVACLIELPFSGNTTPVRKVRFHKPPDDYYSIPYAYITSNLAVASDGTEKAQLTADADEPIVPLHMRHAIIYHALYGWYRDHDDDARSQEAKAEYVDIMLRITSDQQIGSPRPKLQIRSSMYRRNARSPYRSRGRNRFDRGGFDDLTE